MPRGLLTTIVWLAAVGVCACASVPPTRISADYETTAVEAMRAYETYDWLQIEVIADDKSAQPIGEMDLNRFVRSLEAELERRGYARVTDGTANFLVGYDATIQRKMSQSSGNTRVGVGFGSGGSAVGVSTGGGGSNRTYDEATFVVDIVDARSSALVWKGTAQGAVKPPSSPEEREKQLGKVVRDMLKGFPPKPRR